MQEKNRRCPPGQNGGFTYGRLCEAHANKMTPIPYPVHPVKEIVMKAARKFPGDHAAIVVAIMHWLEYERVVHKRFDFLTAKWDSWSG